jgi:hypothetical protein
MIDLSKEENKNNNDSLKIVGNHYDITNISNLEVVEEPILKNKILVTILFILDNDVDNFNSKIKKFYFEKHSALQFLQYLKIYLNIYGIQISFNDKVFGDINFNQIDEVKEEKKENEEKIENEEIVDTKEIKMDDRTEEIDTKNEEDKDKKEKEEKKEEKEEKEGKEEDEKDSNKNGEINEKEEEVFTSENVIESGNKNLIDL